LRACIDHDDRRVVSEAIAMKIMQRPSDGTSPRLNGSKRSFIASVRKRVAKRGFRLAKKAVH
jgi:hypothetical protein